MPTGARLFAALGFAVVAFFASELFKPLLPEGTPTGLLTPINAMIGGLCGWRVMGRLAGKGYFSATGPALQTITVMLFYILLLWAGVEMLDRSFMLHYEGPIEALTAMMELVADYFILMISDPQVPIVLVVGGGICRPPDGVGVGAICLTKAAGVHFMTSVFLYGTLCHTPLREIVLNSAGTVVAATLPGYGVHSVASGRYPMIEARQGASAVGLLLTNVDAVAISRMDYYEGGFGYELAPAKVDVGSDVVDAFVYLPPDENTEFARAWNLDTWAARFGEVACLAADEIMTDMNTRPASAVAQRYGSFTARAQARMNARKTAPSELRRSAVEQDVQIHNRKLAYSQFFSVEEYDLSHRQFSGSAGPDLNRAAFISADAVTVLPYDPIRDRVLLVEQFRTGPLARGDAQPWVLEPIAGRIDGGETPAVAVRREAAEEAGIELNDLHLVAEYYPTPGAKSEFLYGYIGTTDLPDGAAGIGGVAEEGEDIRSHVISFDRAMALIESGEINVGPLILLILHLDRMRPALRANS